MPDTDETIQTWICIACGDTDRAAETPEDCRTCGRDSEDMEVHAGFSLPQD